MVICSPSSSRSSSRSRPPRATRADSTCSPSGCCAACCRGTSSRQATVTSMGSIVGGANLVKKVYFPREHLVPAGGRRAAHHAPDRARPAGVRRSCCFGNMVLPWLPVLLVIVALLACVRHRYRPRARGLNVYFPDLTHLWGIVTMAWFYATPRGLHLLSSRTQTRSAWFCLRTQSDDTVREATRGCSTTSACRRWRRSPTWSSSHRSRCSPWACGSSVGCLAGSPRSS